MSIERMAGHNNIRPHEDESAMLDTTTGKWFLTTSATIMNELEDETCAPC
jgi:hypothetical protein